jgi:hypothetical protein
VVHPQAGDLLEEAKHLLALAPAVEHHRHRPEVHAVGGHEQQVRRHTVELAHEHADPGGSFGDLDAEERLGGQGEHQLVEERRGVVHAGGVGGTLQVGEVLTGLLHAGVEVPDDRLGAHDRSRPQLDHEPQHTVGARVLGPHVEDHRLLAGAAGILELA